MKSYNSWDLIKFFDKQSLIDACDALHKAKVNNKFYRVWYKLNQNTQIEVRTGSGVSARGLAGPVTGQGGGGAALASALNLDLGVQTYFEGSTDEDCYGSIRLQPLSYIDDVIRSSQNILNMIAGNNKLSRLATEKQLKYHTKKSCYLVVGSENYQAKVRLEAKEEPVMLGGKVLEEKAQEKYLGDMLSSEGLSASVESTVKEREGKVKGSIYELRAIVEDFRMQAVSGIESAIDLYESCIVPSLLANCSTWTDIKEQTVKRLDATQDLFGRVLLQVPQSSPRLATRASLGQLGMKWRIWEAKILLVLAIWEQEDSCLARQVLQEQVRMGWPGLAREVRDICHKIGLPDATIEEQIIEKEAVKEAISIDHLQYLKTNMQGEKLRVMSQTDMRERRSYTKYKVEEARMAFRLETFQFDCRANAPSRYGRDLTCRACCPRAGEEPGPAGAGQEEHVENQEHLEVCTAYADLWHGLGPSTPEARCRYFIRVKLRRLQQQQQQI